MSSLKHMFVTKFIFATKFRGLPRDIQQRFIRHIDRLTQNTSADDDDLFAELRLWCIENGVISPEPSVVDNTFRCQDRANAVKNIIQNVKDIPPDALYLDIGCNNGDITFAIGNALGISKQNVYGCDASSSMMSGVCKNFSVVDFNTNDALKTYSPNTFNIVTALMTLHHVKNVKNVIECVHDILIPGGIFIIREHDANVPNIDVVLDLMHAFYDIVWNNDTQITTSKPFVESHFAEYTTREELQSIIVKYGFKVVYSSDVTGGWRHYYTAFVKV